MTVATPLAVLAVGGNVADVGLVLGAGSVPRIAFLLVGGTIADRMSRRLVLIGSDCIQAIVFIYLAILFTTHSASMDSLIIARLIYGTASAFFIPALGGIVPEIVKPQNRQQANAALSLSKSATSVVGPAAAGIIIAVAGVALTFAIDAATFVVSIVCGALLALPGKASRSSSFISSLRGGWKEVRRHRWYWGSLSLHAIWNFAITAWFVLGPVIAARNLGGPEAWGEIVCASALGAIAGSIIAMRSRPQRPLVSANVALALTGLELFALAKPFGLWPICASTLVATGGLAYMNDIWSSVVQQQIPEDLMSRVTSYDWLLSLLAMPAGFAAAGPIAQFMGMRTTLVAAGAAIAALCLLSAGLRPIRTVAWRVAEG